jgi:thiosulfate dehydrogenase [quinone] large subunit
MLAGLRITIGWHFLYEGVAKWMQPDWSAGGYLEASRWLLADLYHWMASNAAVLKVVNLLNIWGLILIGVALILGGLTRLAALAGIALLLLYWLANPPLVGLGLAMPAEGHYLVINKNVVEMLALAVVAVMSAGQCFGLDRLLQNLISARRRAPAGKATGATPAPTAAETVPPAQPAEEFPEVSARREVLKSLIGVPVLAGFAGAVACERRWRSYEEKNLADAAAAPSAKMLDATSLAEKLQGQLPLARVGDKQRSALFSRVILGGNLLNGNAHARDLLYCRAW